MSGTQAIDPVARFLYNVFLRGILCIRVTSLFIVPTLGGKITISSPSAGEIFTYLFPVNQEIKLCPNNGMVIAMMLNALYTHNIPDIVNMDSLQTYVDNYWRNMHGNV